MNPDARPFIPTFARSQNQRQVYSRAALKEIELSVVENIRSASLAKIKLIPPAPVNFVSLVKLPSALEFLNVDHVVTLVRSGECSTNAKTPLWSSRVQPNTLSSSTRSVLPHPNQCQDGLEGCPIIQEVISSAVRKAASSRLGALLLQSGDVVLGLLQLALVFEARQSSLRLRLLAEQHPNVVNRIKEYLCGEGYHLPLPSVISHEDWQTLNSILKFDWIRDNRTRIFTEISKRWKKRHTQFEQFVHFFEYRDDRPLHPVKNMLTHSTTPVLVSVLSGDVMAVVLLARLGFFVPPDYYWDIFSFFAESLLPKSSDGEMYNLMRHLCLHLAERQQALRGDVFNPILPPQKK
ncbi:hypothetical protein LSM04_001880 [Trypanosoma melophagium]|uniref:uncharacterized protein n=1 Tax=Trypanosoma melophagium TaxID=715481 RepID=UPI00351A4310|nr:hypothetical protein LSM04_001880 [Trypanosoma melophagium]